MKRKFLPIPRLAARWPRLGWCRPTPIREPAARGGDQGLLDAQPFPAGQGVVNAAADGSGIGFSLVWLNDKDGNLWMCDAELGGPSIHTPS